MKQYTFITEFLDEHQGTNPDFLLAREHVPEPIRGNTCHHFLLVPKAFDIKQWRKDDLMEVPLDTIKHYTFIRTLIQIPGATFWCWKCTEDNKFYI